jgi:UDP-galactopyranose mutase
MGRDPKELPSSIIRRLPIRLTFDDNYFNDKYQGIPIGGYTKMIENMQDGIEVRLGVDFF